MLTIQPARTGQAAICEMILKALPDWFGIKEANRHYIAYTDHNPTYIAFYADHNPVGFLALKQHFPESAEIYVMAVLSDHHRRGIGRALIEAAEADLRRNNTQFLQVKTLGLSHPDEGYQKTRLFYLGMGFIPLEEFDNLWPGNPALLLVKHLG